MAIKPNTNPELVTTCKTLFVETWPKHANIILKIFKNSKIPEVGAFYKKYDDLLEQGKIFNLFKIIFFY